MTGISSAVRQQISSSFLPIVLREKKCSIGYTEFDRCATDEQLLRWTDEILKVFKKLEIEVIRSGNITLSEGTCKNALIELAMWGRRAYNLHFEEEARQLFSARAGLLDPENITPTFISEEVPFPWELLYFGDDYHTGDSELFFGVKYAPARILIPRKDISQHLLDQERPSDMLFCLHHQLRQAHHDEWPTIEQIVRETPGDRFHILGPLCVSNIHDGDAFLSYLDEAPHNMVHFACHCRPGPAGADSLIVSLLRDENDKNPEIIELETYDFVDVKGIFQRQPLVFLNACQSVGGSDDLRKTFNLPLEFIQRGAAAVIATACPVPDLFAASFARHFYQRFLKDHLNIGQALRLTRRHFLENHHNPLGLAYGLYSPAQYQVTLTPAETGK